MVVRSLLAALLLAAGISAAHAVEEDFGVCTHQKNLLLSKGGAIAKVTHASYQLYGGFNVLYRHQFGEAWGTFDTEWKDFNTPEARAAGRNGIFSQIKAEQAAIASTVGTRFWYLVVNLAVVATGNDPLIVTSDIDPDKTTTWRSYIMYIRQDVCIWAALDNEIFPENLPEGIREQLPK